MRYLNGDLDQPSPLYVRLWEARRGAILGFFECAVLLGFLAVALFVAARIEHAVTQTNFGWAGFSMLLSWWKLVLVIACCTAYQFWMQELEIVNQDSSSLEQVIDSRLKAIEQRVFPERYSQQGQS